MCRLGRLCSFVVNADEMIGELGVGYGFSVLRHVTGYAALPGFDRASGLSLERISGAFLGRGRAIPSVASVALEASRFVVVAGGFGVAMGVAAGDTVEPAAALAIASALGKRGSLKSNFGGGCLAQGNVDISVGVALTA
jgi:hypothetical protein